MKKNLFYAVVAIGMLASCVDNEFVGEVTPNPGTEGTNAIVFNSGAKTVTRSGEIYGAAAADLLNKNFVVEGIKTIVGENDAKNIVEVFDNYNVNWVNNSANTTASNTANWEYAGQPTNSHTLVSEQSIKYWDFAASQYDFWAYSLGNAAANSVTITRLDHDATLNGTAYTIKGALANLANVYISDLVTCYPVGTSFKDNDNNDVTVPIMGDQVNLTFRSLVTKVRVGLYETIPGYSVKNVLFYTEADDANPGANAVLYATGNVLPTVGTDNTAEYVVQFSHIGSTNILSSDYNKAHVFLNSSDKTSTVEFGQLNYGNKHAYEKTATDNIWLHINSAQPTWAKETNATKAGDYSIVLPNETGAVLTLKVDYTLESTDGSGEEITVHGATALLPSQYTQWKPNYAYTYLFKISDNTNGLTNPAVTSKEGLYPITLDAIVIAPEDGQQETITTVATPSITTYSLTSDVTQNNEYTASDEIYVTATTDGSLIEMTGKANLYQITINENNSDVAYAATEAEVLDALTTYSDLANDGTYTGRNGIKLSPVDTESWNLTETSIPLIDGNTVGVNAGEVAKIIKNKLTAGNYYAFVYEVTEPGTPTEKNEYTIVSVSSNDDVTNYFVSDDGGQSFRAATANEPANTIYYQKEVSYSVTNGVYGIKVIKIKAADQNSNDPGNGNNNGNNDPGNGGGNDPGNGSGNDPGNGGARTK
ncbi:MAG: hypothetical protein IKY01_13155 [Prevotella sp.]|nr:hypothetical protein [Prevotella sp.]